MRIAESYDVLIDASDNFPTRYLVNDAAVMLGKPDVYGAIYRFEGQLSVFDARQGPCYRCLFPEPPPPYMVTSCGDGGVLGVLPGTIGTMQATEAIKLILGVGSTMVGRLLLYDALEMSTQFVSLPKNPHCPVCGPHPQITQLIDYEEFCGMPAHDQSQGSAGEEWDIAPAELAKRLGRGEDIRLVDVREPVELQVSRITDAEVIPFGQFAARMGELRQDQEVVLFCRTGNRSTRALQMLVQAGFTRVKNLRGGINAWAKEIDPAMKRY